jgi:hypothetical protein
MSFAMLARKAESAEPAKAKAPSRGAFGSLRIGAPDDAYEQEADRIADRVMAGERVGPQWSFSRMNVEALSRKCSCGGSGGADGECEECKKKGETLQRKAAGAGSPGEAPPIVHDVLRSPGEPLDRATRAFFEPRFGRDFSQVRVHSDAKAAESARAVNALAYTVGQDIVIGPGEVQQASAASGRLLAHELTHTIQQSFHHGAAPRLQRLSADPSAAPKMTCVANEALGANAEIALTGVKLAALSAAQKKQIAEYYKGWVDRGSKEFIAVDGYASPDSANDSADQQRANWRYSCHRAEIVQAEFVKLGVPQSRVITFAHGETDKFSTKDPAQNRRVEISSVQVSAKTAPPEPPPVEAPGGVKITGNNEKVDVKPTANKNIPVKPTTLPDAPKEAETPEQRPERQFSITLEFDLKNDWKKPKPPPATGPEAPFACDHGVIQLGAKWNKGITVFKDRLEFLSEPELDVSIGPAFCGQNPGVTAQVNFLKYTILKDVIETDLVGFLGLPDGWATGLNKFPFTHGGQLKLQSTPFAKLSPDFKGLKIGLFGGISFEQGVPSDAPGVTKVLTVGGFIGLDYDVGPTKKEEKK